MVTVIFSIALVYWTGETWPGCISFAVGVLIDSVMHRSME